MSRRRVRTARCSTELDEDAPQRDLRPPPGAAAAGVGRDAPRRPARVGGRRAVDDPRPRRRRAPGGMSQALEERFLFFLLLLRQPTAAAWSTSPRQPINPLIVDYYLSLLPGVIPSHARARLSLVSVDDSGPEPLSREDARPAPADRPHPRPRSRTARCATSIPYNTTSLERDLAAAARHPHVRRGPAARSRSARRPDAAGCSPRAGVRYPPGVEDLHSRDDLEEALLALRAQRPGIRAAMVKLNEGVSGTGNAVVDLADLPAPGSPAGAGAPWRARVEDMELEDTRIDARRLPRQARGARRHRRGAGRRRRAAQPERADAGDPARRGRGALHPRPGARRAERAVLPRLPVPRRPRRTPA